MLGGIVLAAVPATAQLVPCGTQTDWRAVTRALHALVRSVDPCGQSAEVRAVVETVEHCPRATYEICTDPTATRNVFDRPRGPHGEALPRRITWNPALRSEIEASCDGDPAATVRRDPTASLLHELAHAAQDCAGLNPGAHELEAVRIENIYRRAAGVCQRSGYGDTLLPARMVTSCAAGHCSCATPPAPTAPGLRQETALSEAGRLDTAVRGATGTARPRPGDR